MTNELKPCPFCGNEKPDIVNNYLDERFGYALEVEISCCVSVSSRGAIKEGAYADNSGVLEKAFGMWNHRPYENKLRAENETLKQRAEKAECEREKRDIEQQIKGVESAVIVLKNRAETIFDRDSLMLTKSLIDDLENHCKQLSAQLEPK